MGIPFNSLGHIFDFLYWLDPPLILPCRLLIICHWRTVQTSWEIMVAIKVFDHLVRTVWPGWCLYFMPLLPDF